MGKWIESPDRPQKGNSRATALIWLWEKICRLVDVLTLDLMTGKSWVKKAGSRCALPEAAPQEAERPHPWPPETDREKHLREAYAERRAAPVELQGMRKAAHMMVQYERARLENRLDIGEILKEIEEA